MRRSRSHAWRGSINVWGRLWIYFRPRYVAAARLRADAYSRTDGQWPGLHRHCARLAPRCLFWLPHRPPFPHSGGCTVQGRLWSEKYKNPYFAASSSSQRLLRQEFGQNTIASRWSTGKRREVFRRIKKVTAQLRFSRGRRKFFDLKNYQTSYTMVEVGQLLCILHVFVVLAGLKVTSAAGKYINLFSQFKYWLLWFCAYLDKLYIRSLIC
jgi:hypothetical protein